MSGGCGLWGLEPSQSVAVAPPTTVALLQSVSNSQLLASSRVEFV